MAWCRLQANVVQWADAAEKQISAPKSALPDADPGDLIAHRWRNIF